MILKASFAGMGPSLIQSKVQQWATEIKDNPGKANAVGQEMVNGKGPGGKATVAGAIGKAVATELPNSPNLNTIPKIFMGFQQGGFSGGMSQMGSAISSGMDSLFGSQKQGSIEDSLPAGVVNQIGAAFKGSPAAQSAANTVAPAVNKTFDHLLQNSIFGTGLKMLADPSAYLADKAKEFGLGGASEGTTPGVTTTGGAGGTS